MSDITPLLLDAKREYTQRLQEIVEPQITSTFADLFEKSDYDYYEFQQALRQVPYWNSTIVNLKTQYFMTQFPWFDNLVAAVVVTYVKVLSAIRLGDKPNVKLQLPKTEDFVHELYKQVARIVYYAPETIESHETMMTAVGDGIENSIRRLIPYDAILESYLAPPEQPQAAIPNTSGSSDSSDSDSDSGSDDDDEDIKIPMPPQYGQPQTMAPPEAGALGAETPPQFGDDVDDDDEDEEDHDGSNGFVAPSSYPAPPPDQPASVAPVPPPVAPQAAPPVIPTVPVPQPTQTAPPPQQLFGSPQIRSGF
jgi:hypothetical protein